MIIVYRMCGKFIFLISPLSFQIIEMYLFVKRSDVGGNTGEIFFLIVPSTMSIFSVLQR